MSRAEEHQLDLRPRRVRPQQLLESAVQAATPGFTTKNVALHIAHGDNAPDVDVDAERIDEVLANLLENALRHTPAGGTVTLAAARDGNAAVLTITDTGDGLERDELERIFERFYRTDTARSRDRGGSGIGLTISRAIVEAHGGTLRAESEGPGQGTRFVCTLPLA